MRWQASTSGIVGELVGDVVGDAARRLGDPHEGEHAEVDGDRVDLRHVAAQDPARLELLDPLVRRRAAHADLGADLRVGAAAVPLEDVEDPGVGRIDLGFSGHLVPVR